MSQPIPIPPRPAEANPHLRVQPPPNRPILIRTDSYTHFGERLDLTKPPEVKRAK